MTLQGFVTLILAASLSAAGLGFGVLASLPEHAPVAAPMIVTLAPDPPSKPSALAATQPPPAAPTVARPLLARAKRSRMPAEHPLPHASARPASWRPYARY